MRSFIVFAFLLAFVGTANAGVAPCKKQETVVVTHNTTVSVQVKETVVVQPCGGCVKQTVVAKPVVVEPCNCCVKQTVVAESCKPCRKKTKVFNLKKCFEKLKPACCCK